MVKPAEKPKVKPTGGNEVNGTQKAEKERKKPPPATPLLIRKGL